ncbi:MAG: hypothetical protein AAF690_11410 [Acidobacteriota bacterium]
MLRRNLNRILVLSVAFALGVAACTPSSPEEQVASVRGQYTAELVSWRVEQIPEASEESAAEATEESESAEAPSEEGEIAIEVPDHLSANLVNNLYFDILVSTGAADPLTTLTVDLTHAAATQEEKQVYRLPLDVSGVVKGSGEQITATLENVEDFEEGDLFSVEVRTSVGEDERSEYAEFGG